MIDALFFSRIPILFLKQQQYIVLVTPSLSWHICGVLCWQWNGRGGGCYCVEITNPPPRATHRWENRPTHPTDRPTGTTYFSFGGLFFFACALHLSSRSNRAAATSRTTTKMSPYFCIVRCHYYRTVYYYYPLNYVLQCLLFCYVWWLWMAINISVQNSGGLLPDMILLTQGQRVPRTVFFPWRIVQSI